MKIAFIGSLHDMERVHAKGDIELALTHLFEHASYRNYYRNIIDNQIRPVILDNSIVELGDALAGDQVLEVAREFTPDVIVAPDCFHDRKETIERTIKFCRDKYRIPELRRVKTMAVAHGKSWEQWQQCFTQHMQNENVDIIGLPFSTTWAVPGIDYTGMTKTVTMMNNRLAMTAWISKSFRRPKPCHLLGANNPVELRTQRSYGFVESHDSSAAYSCARNELLLDFKDGLGAREKFKMDFSWTLSDPQFQMFLENVKTIRSWVK